MAFDRPHRHDEPVSQQSSSQKTESLTAVERAGALAVERGVGRGRVTHVRGVGQDDAGVFLTAATSLGPAVTAARLASALRSVFASVM